MSETFYPAIAFGIFCLLVGILLLAVGVRRGTNRPHLIIMFSCLLIALGAVVTVFAIFPDSSASGTILRFKVGGAFAGLIVLFWLLMKYAEKANALDDLQRQVRERDAEIERLNKEARKGKPIPNCQKHAYTVRKGGKKLVLITGDIKDIKGIDVWVNSENTEMEMARFSDHSVSASIRYWGAKRYDGGNVKDGGDTIATALRDELKKAEVTCPVQPASLFLTTPGELTEKGVKQIFHIAAVQGNKTKGYEAVKDLESCVRKALDKVQQLKDQTYKSILFPLLATATGKGKLETIAPRLIETALLYLEENPDHILDTVYFLTYTDIELETCQEILATLQGRVTPA